ncbi:MAG TPA: hypothetical protein VFE60_06555 [Roseiarcus sp.]|jgi:hypothetical protein|nr:hypothetical protein [Roseiarcus sp.]
MRHSLTAACAIRLKALAEKLIQSGIRKAKPGETDMAEGVLERERWLQTDARTHVLGSRKGYDQSSDELDSFADFVCRRRTRRGQQEKTRLADDLFGTHLV